MDERSMESKSRDERPMEREAAACRTGDSGRASRAGISRHRTSAHNARGRRTNTRARRGCRAAFPRSTNSDV